LPAAIRELEQLGLKRIDECVRLGAAVMIERCVVEYRSRGDVGPGWLAAAIRQGGSWFADQPARPESATDLVLGMWGAS
jgi:hypothetical protein